MKKSVSLFLLLFTLILLSACSNSSADDSKAKKEQDIQSNEQKEKGSAEHVNNAEEKPFIFQYDNLEIELDKSLKDSLDINDTAFFYSDEILTEQDIMIGTMTSMSLDEWENGNWNGGYALVYYDHNGVAYIFEFYYDWPYSNNEFTSQYENYVYTFESLVKNLLIYGFHSTDLKMKQAIPVQLDLNQEYGIEVSRVIYRDLQNWYTTLKTSFENEISLKEKYQVISTVGQEVEQAYPEFRQIPFPSIMLGENIVNATNLLKEWSESPYRAEKASHLNIDNKVEMLRQYLEVIDKQITELENS